MFRLPNNSESFDKLKSFSSYMLFKHGQDQRKMMRPVSSSVHQRSKSHYQQQSRKSMKHHIRPKSSISKSVSEHKYASAFFSQKIGNNICEQILISPCNKKFKYCITNLDSNHIDAKFTKSNFLLQPCKISSIPITTRRQLIKEFVFTPQNGKYSSPYCKELNKRSTGRNTPKIKASNLREKNHKRVIKKQEQIDPWQIGECYFQSIKLNQKNSDI